MIYKLLICDLDSTLYDWVTYFSYAHRSTVEWISSITKENVANINFRYKKSAIKFKDVEYPFILGLLHEPDKLYSAQTTSETFMNGRTINHLAEKVFDIKSREALIPYETVIETLEEIQNKIPMVIYTDASGYNAYRRLTFLNLLKYFNKVYTKNSYGPFYMELNKFLPNTFEILEKGICKPSPATLEKICNDFSVKPSEVIFIGDSLDKDIAGANAVGMTSVWAKYGAVLDKASWDYLKTITGMPEKDVEERMLKLLDTSIIKPTHTITSFSQIASIL